MRWKNAARNAWTDTHHEIDSNHFPLNLWFQVKLARPRGGVRKGRVRYLRPLEDQRERFSDQVMEELKGILDSDEHPTELVYD